jgi:hypothetical protein
MNMLLKRSARDFLTCGLSNEGRAREPARGSSCIDLINERFVERNVDPYSSAGIGKQWNSKQDSPFFERCFYISVTQNIVRAPRSRQSSSGTFKRFRMLPQRNGRIASSLFQCVTRRETSFHVRKPDAEGAVSFLFHNRHVTRRHCFQISSRPPAGQFVDAAHQSNRQIPPWMCHRNDHIPLGMLIRVVITVNSIKRPSILLQHPNQLAAVSFHVPCSEAAPRLSLGRQCFRSGGVCPHARDRVYKSR